MSKFVPKGEQLKGFSVVNAVKLPWRPSALGKLNEYKLTSSAGKSTEEFIAGEHMLYVRHIPTGAVRGIPYANVRDVDFA
jgi:hypothetical protein